MAIPWSLACRGKTGIPRLRSGNQADMLDARRLVARALHVSIEAVQEDTSMDTLEAWDSLGQLRIVLAIEEEIDNELTVEQVISIENILDVANLLQL